MSIRKTNFIKPKRITVEPVHITRPRFERNQPVQQNRMTPAQKRERALEIKAKIEIAEQRKRDIRERLNNPIKHNTYKYGAIAQEWAGQTVFIVGGGASLKGFDFNKIRGKKVIAINKAFQAMPDADYLYWTDSRFYAWYKKEIDLLKCKKVTPAQNCKDLADDIILLRNSGGRIIDMAPDKICAGNNSGFGAINLALKLGAKRIFLLGYDMGLTGNHTHFHDGYPAGTARAHIYKGMVKYFEENVEIINSMAEVYNLNPKSELKCFKFMTVEKALTFF